MCGQSSARNIRFFGSNQTHKYRDMALASNWFGGICKHTKRRRNPILSQRHSFRDAPCLSLSLVLAQSQNCIYDIFFAPIQSLCGWWSIEKKCASERQPFLVCVCVWCHRFCYWRFVLANDMAAMIVPNVLGMKSSFLFFWFDTTWYDKKMYWMKDIYVSCEIFFIFNEFEDAMFWMISQVKLTSI